MTFIGIQTPRVISSFINVVGLNNRTSNIGKVPTIIVGLCDMPKFIADLALGVATGRHRKDHRVSRRLNRPF